VEPYGSGIELAIRETFSMRLVLYRLDEKLSMLVDQGLRSFMLI